MKFSLVHWLIAVALLANAAVFYWQQTRPASVARVDTGGLRELKLLSEVDEDELAAATYLPAPPVEVPAPAERPTPEPMQNEPVPEQSLAGGPEPETGPLPVDNEESALAAAVAGSGEPEEAESPAPEFTGPEPPWRCWLAGPVDNDALNEQLTVDFAAAGVSMDLVLQATEITPDSWVHLPTSGEQADVRRLSQELRQVGIDNFPINSGPLAGSLSVGLFRSERRAIAVRDSLRSRGYEQVEIYKRPRFAELPWITLDRAGRVALGWPAEEGDLPGYEDLRLLAVECDQGS
ncbi:MAG: hypothetical protein QNI86_12715 [Halieaceae bacterium]|nr:hypothetical protein [Halieaceae bacterium]